MFFNYTCLDSCPEGYIVTETRGCAPCSTGLYYYNHTCVSNCPLTTYGNQISYGLYTCQPCSLGCDTCINGTKYGCLTCSEGYFYLTNTCSRGCPSDMYANPETRACQQCHPSCATCSHPNDQSCTSCPTGNYLLEGTCVTGCPSTYYHSFLGESEEFQVPACLPKRILSFSLSLSINSRVIYINFNYGITYMILAVTQRTRIRISNIEIDPELFMLSPLTESKVKFEYLGDQYYPSLSLLNVTIDLDSDSDYNSDLYEEFLIINKSQTVQLKEIYPFTNTEMQAISSSSSFTSMGGSTIATIQAVSSVSQGALSAGLIRMQIVGEIVQLMRFIDIRWPPNVVQFFETSHIDPTSMLLPIDFITSWNHQLSDRNTSMPRIFQNYETRPFFTENYNSEISNLVLWGAIIFSLLLLISFLKKKLRKMTAVMPMPKTNARGKKRSNCIRLIHKTSRMMNRIDDSILTNFILTFLLSCFQPGIVWSFLNIRYSSTLLEPATSFTIATLGLACISLIFFLLLAAFIFKVILNGIKYVLKIKESLRPPALKRYQCLFEDFENQKILQILCIPISLIRSLIFAGVISLLCTHGLTQLIFIWSADFCFILYMIIYHPLKNKWNMRITLAIEVFTFGCITLGLIFDILERVAVLDAITLDEVGFAFIALSILSTISGVLISLIQVLGLVKTIYNYLKEVRRRRREVQPISLSPISGTSKRVDTVFMDAHAGGKVLKADSTSSLEQKGPCDDTSSPLNSLDRSTRLIRTIGNFSPDIFKKVPHGEEHLSNLEKWLASFNSDSGGGTGDLSHTKSKAGRKSMTPKTPNNRIILFSSE